MSKVLSVEKTQNLFGFLLTYSYLLPLYEVEDRLHLRKTPIIFGFSLDLHYLCTDFSKRVQNPLRAKALLRRVNAVCLILTASFSDSLAEITTAGERKRYVSSGIVRRSLPETVENLIKNKI